MGHHLRAAAQQAEGGGRHPAHPQPEQPGQPALVGAPDQVHHVGPVRGGGEVAQRVVRRLFPQGLAARHPFAAVGGRDPEGGEGVAAAVQDLLVLGVVRDRVHGCSLGGDVLIVVTTSATRGSRGSRTGGRSGPASPLRPAAGRPGGWSSRPCSGRPPAAAPDPGLGSSRAASRGSRRSRRRSRRPR